MVYDIVITWVDWSDKNFIKKLIESGGRSEGCESGDFIELKYLLRSLEKHKVPYRKIFIVHSDNHPPPKYLIETDKLKFIRHSKIVKNKSYLPLIHRESIIAHLHRIPDLQKIYFYIEDDHFIMNKKIFDSILLNYKKRVIFGKRNRMKNNYDVLKSMGLYNQSMVNSSKMFNNEATNHLQQTHWIQIFDKSIMSELEHKYENEFNMTMSYKNQKKESHKEKHIIASTCLFYNFLLYNKNFTLKSPNELNITSIHTNNGMDKKILKEKLHASLNKWYLNAQGDGISDEYPKNKAIHDIFYSFLERIYPNKTEYEKHYKLTYEHFDNIKNYNTELLIIIIIIILLLLYKLFK